MNTPTLYILYLLPLILSAVLSTRSLQAMCLRKALSSNKAPFVTAVSPHLNTTTQNSRTKSVSHLSRKTQSNKTVKQQHATLFALQRKFDELPTIQIPMLNTLTRLKTAQKTYEHTTLRYEIAQATEIPTQLHLALNTVENKQKIEPITINDLLTVTCLGTGTILSMILFCHGYESFHYRQ